MSTEVPEARSRAATGTRPRTQAFASGVSLSRPDLHTFVFSGDGDAFSIGGNHFNHTARKNIKLSLVVMDNWVYGLTKKQTSPTSPLGFKSKTDQWGAVEQPINPLKQAISAGATLTVIARPLPVPPASRPGVPARAPPSDRKDRRP